MTQLLRSTSPGEWLAATLAPWSVAPHPNFGTDAVSDAALFALIVELRIADLETKLEEVGGSPAGLDFLRAARSVVDYEAQSNGAELLLKLIQDDGLPEGPTFAAAALASVAFGEIDKPTKALAILDRTLARLKTASFAGGTKSLMQACLQLHRALRFLEMGVDQHASEAIKAAREECVRVQVDDVSFDMFETSRGTSLSSQGIQRQCAEMLSTHVAALAAQLEPWEGNLWMSVVRSPRPLIDSRSEGVLATGLAAINQSEFEKATAGVRPTRRLYREDPVYRPLGASLMAAQLTCDSHAIAHRSIQVAYALAREPIPAERPWTAGEALRLVRQARSLEPLKRLVRYLRGNGPLRVLVDDSLRILEKFDDCRFVTREDVEVLTAAADLFGTEESRRAFEVTVAYGELGRPVGDRDTPPSKWTRWPEREAAWSLLARVMNQTDQKDSVPGLVVRHLISQAPGSIGETRSLVRLVRGLDWSKLSDYERRLLSEWAGAQKDADRETGQLVSALRAAASLEPSVVENDPSHPQDEMATVAEAIAEGRPVAPASLQSGLREGVTRLSRIADDARRGAYGFGGYDDAALLYDICVHAGESLPWDVFCDFLLEEAVAPEHKAGLLDRLATDVPQVPLEERRRLRGGWPTLLRPAERRHFFSLKSAGPVFGPALRAGLALRLISGPVYLAMLGELASASDPHGRAEAARSVLVGARLAHTRSASLTVCLGLSFDSDPVVRAAAAATLTECHLDARGLTAAVVQRMQQLLREDGILVPSAILRRLVGMDLPRSDYERLSEAVGDVAVRFSGGPGILAEQVLLNEGRPRLGRD